MASRVAERVTRVQPHAVLTIPLFEFWPCSISDSTSDHSKICPMRYRVDELAQHAGVSVDTVRFYQGQGLIEPPEREGRIVWYHDGHARRLARIRQLSQAGFTLRQIHELVAGVPDPILGALERDTTSPTLSLEEVSAQTGVSADVLTIGVESGLLRAQRSGVHEQGSAIRFDETQVGMVATVARLLASGVDVDALIRLAIRHAAATEDVVAEAVDLYRDAVLSERTVERDSVAADLQILVPAVTQLVAAHFSQTLVSRGAAVLADIDQDDLSPSQLRSPDPLEVLQ